MTELIHDLEQEMIRLGYSKGTMKIYRRHWKKFAQFAKERGESFYSEQLGLDFVEQYFHISEKEFNERLTQTEVQKLRTIWMIGDFQLYGAILCRNCKNKNILTDPYFIAIRAQFHSYCNGIRFFMLLGILKTSS